MRRHLPLILSLLLPVICRGALSTAPLADPSQAVWAHAPFEAGECALCHERSDPADPGAVTQPVDDLCFTCHDQFAEQIHALANVHAPVAESCVNCHNPHNAAQMHLLLAPVPDLCGECHDDVLEKGRHAAVRHQPVTEGKACLNCHDAHAADVQYLLPALPYDLCLSCHGTDGLTDDQGRALPDLKALFEKSHMRHGPVEDKDCSACHEVHGSENFRLLISEYPARFYAPYEPQDYALCFSCHESDVFDVARTTTLTGFRDGDRNLHYLHVHKKRRGRTCRACHDVHAAPHDHLIRDGVPYGSSGWILKINFQATDHGGLCAKTCHDTRVYDRRPAEAR